MDRHYKVSQYDFIDYLQSIVKQDAQKRINNFNKSLYSELADSQNAIKDIKNVFDSITMAHMTAEAENNGSRLEVVSKALDAGEPKLLLPDMIENNIEVDLDDVIAILKYFAEDIKKNVTDSHQQASDALKEMKGLDIEQYASSLDQLSKRLAKIKLSKCDDVNNRNLDLEAKLTQLCDDVNMFTQMVESKTTLSKCNKNWTNPQEDGKALHYIDIINKLLSGINEVTYLRQNKN